MIRAILGRGTVRLSLLLLLVVGILTLGAPWLGLPDPEEVNLVEKLAPPSSQHLLGRTIWGGICCRASYTDPGSP